MVDKLIIAPEALNDISDSYGWYEQRRVGLGEEFLMCVDACIEQIQRIPGSNQIIHLNFRRGLVRRFPFAVIYEYEQNIVTVYAVFHNSRNPQKWKERTLK